MCVAYSLTDDLKILFTTIKKYSKRDNTRHNLNCAGSFGHERKAGQVYSSKKWKIDNFAHMCTSTTSINSYLCKISVFGEM